MSEPVLERSVLERKERDELQTIARAMGVEPPARARKADLVDAILTAAGITGPTPRTPDDLDSPPSPLLAADADDSPPPPAEVPPTRTRRRSARAAAPTTEDQPSAVDLVAPGAEPSAIAEPAEREVSPARTNGQSTASAPSSDADDGQAGPNWSSSPVTGSDIGGGAEPVDDHGAGGSDDGDGEVVDGNGLGDGRGEGDPGNRRRRRRGRDRERTDRPVGSEERDDAYLAEPVAIEGLLDLRDDGYGFVRTKGYLPSKDDAYVSVKQVRQHGLRKGDLLVGLSRPAARNEKNPALLRIDSVNGGDVEAARSRKRFEDLTPLFPDEKLRLETPSDPSNMTARIVDLVSPIGKGQRGLVVSPPKAGKTTVLKQIVRSIETNNPEVHLMVLLVDERPEEVTDMRRWTAGEVVASTFDRPSDEHTMVAELAIERAKRLVEVGRDVVIVLDGITRLARAYNLAAPATGRIMSGGVDSGALYPPKRFFGSARNVEEGGSLTILATALIETGSRMDEVIFEEFKGTGNMELRLDRRLAERRVYPAIDVDASSTRHEELLFDRTQLQQVWRVRRALNALAADGAGPGAALERLMDGMKTYKTNAEFLDQAAKAGAG